MSYADGDPALSLRFPVGLPTPLALPNSTFRVATSLSLPSFVKLAVMTPALQAFCGAPTITALQECPSQSSALQCFEGVVASTYPRAPCAVPMTSISVDRVVTLLSAQQSQDSQQRFVPRSARGLLP